MNMKKGDLLNLWYVLEGMKHQKQGVKFSYFVAKNKLAIKGEVEALDAAREVSEAFKAYDTKRAALAAEMADKLPGVGTPMTENGQYVIKERKEEFDKALSELKEQFARPIAEREEQIATFNELLDEKVEFKNYKIKFGDIPSSIEPSVMEIFILADLVIEEE